MTTNVQHVWSHHHRQLQYEDDDNYSTYKSTVFIFHVRRKALQIKRKVLIFGYEKLKLDLENYYTENWSLSKKYSVHNYSIQYKNITRTIPSMLDMKNLECSHSTEVFRMPKKQF